MKSILLPAALFVAACLSARAATYVVGDRIDLALPDGQPSFSLSIVAAPPAGIAGQSYIARDMNGEASAIVKPTADGLRVTIDDKSIDTAFSLGTLTPSGDGYPWTPEALRMLSPEDFTALVRRFGAERVYFGTDSPWADQAEALRALRALPLTEAELDRILGRNAMELLGLEEETAS